MELSAIVAAYNGLRYAKDTLTMYVEGKIELDSQAKVLEALGKLGAAQDAMFEMRESLFALQSENSRLTQELERQHAWKER